MRRIVAIMTTAGLVLNLVAFGFGWVGPLVFWLVILVGATIAWKVLPRLD